MLKIKDSVNLKELEKFGFVRNRSLYGSLDFYDKTVFGVDIIINTERNEITIVNDFTYIDEDFLDTIFDLIQAGLVEKVEVE